MTWTASFTKDGAFALTDDASGQTLMKGSTDPAFGPQLLEVLSMTPETLQALILCEKTLGALVEVAKTENPDAEGLPHLELVHALAFGTLKRLGIEAVRAADA